MDHVALVANELLGTLSLEQAKAIITILKDKLANLEVKLVNAENERLTEQSILKTLTSSLHQPLLTATTLQSDNVRLRAEVDSLIKSRNELSARNKELDKKLLQYRDGT